MPGRWPQCTGCRERCSMERGAAGPRARVCCHMLGSRPRTHVRMQRPSLPRYATPLIRPSAARRASLWWRCCWWCPGWSSGEGSNDHCCLSVHRSASTPGQVPGSAAHPPATSQLLCADACSAATAHTLSPSPSCHSELDKLKGSGRRGSAESARHALHRLRVLTAERDSFVRAQTSAEHMQVDPEGSI